jgi:hypothetical protein
MLGNNNNYAKSGMVRISKTLVYYSTIIILRYTTTIPTIQYGGGGGGGNDGSAFPKIHKLFLISHPKILIFVIRSIAVSRKDSSDITLIKKFVEFSFGSQKLML